MARSDNWRINKSSLMAVEGAQILKALQKVAGAAGLPEGFKVRFATNKTGAGIDIRGKELIVGAGRLFDEAPMPADKFDVLVGLVLHEVMHNTIETEKVLQRTIFNRFITDAEAKMLKEFVNIGEDIAIESQLMANPNLVDYGDALFAWATAKMKEAHPNKLMELWVEYGLGHKADRLTNLPPEMDEPMAELVALTGWLRQPHNWSDRVDAYLRYWNVLRDIILHPPEPPQQLVGAETPPDQSSSGTDTSTSSDEQPSAPAPESEKRNDGDSKQKAPEEAAGSKDDAEPDEGDDDGDSDSGIMDNDEESDEEDGDEPEEDSELKAPLTQSPADSIDEALAEAIDDAIQSDSEDVTDQVRKEFTNLSGGVAQRTPAIVRSRESKTPLIKPDPTLCKKLERIMTIRKRLQARIMHGEQYGRIDKRHLHRVVTDERIFNLKYKFPDGFPNTKILIDISGSMSGRQADEVLQAAGALQTLVNAEVWCYDETQAVNLVRVDAGKLIHQVDPGGNTPSGLAIVGVSIGMKHGGLVIHLTDGEHNTGEMPWNAHWVLKKRGVELVNLIWGRSTKHYDYDGMNCRRLDGLAEFPDALYSILIEKAKLSKIGGR